MPDFLKMDIKQILKEKNFRFNKAYGQNFITDKNLLAAIACDSGVMKEDTVIEIGAGAGTLTRELLACAKKVIAFEIDRNLKPVLEETLKGFDNLQICFDDIMKFPFSKLHEMTGGAYKVVANLPYYITTPIIMLFLEQETPLQSMSIMVQKEVADRLCARENTPEYGSITVGVQSVADVKITRTVKRELFYPVPNVDSAIVKIDLKSKYQFHDQALFKKLYKSAFLMRRKTLCNNLISAFQMKREEAEELLSSCGLDIGIRGEAVSVPQFVSLQEKLFFKLSVK